MGDPFSAAASVFGIAVPALHGMRLLLDDIQNIKDAPKLVLSLADDLESTEVALKSLQNMENSVSNMLSQDIVKGMRVAIDICTKSCDDFRADLSKWTRHSKRGTLSWQDRANVGFFRQQRINTLSEKLQYCKSTVNVFVDVATLQSSLRHASSNEKMETAIMSKQAEIVDNVSIMNQGIMSINEKLQRWSIIGTIESADDAHERTKAIREAEEEKSALLELQKVLNLLSSTTGQRTWINISNKNVRSSEGGKTLTGMFNTQGKYANVTIKNDDIEATTQGKIITGVVEGYNFDNF